MRLIHAFVTTFCLTIPTQIAAASWNVTYSGRVLFPTIQRTEVFGSGLPGTVWDIEITATVASGSSYGTMSLTAASNDSIRHCTVNI